MEMTGFLHDLFDHVERVGGCLLPVDGRIDGVWLPTPELANEFIAVARDDSLWYNPINEKHGLITDADLLTVHVNWR